MFVSNSEFLPVEFESWRKYSNQAGVKPPTTSFIAQKAAEIHKYLTNPISDERVVEQVRAFLIISLGSICTSLLCRVIISKSVFGQS